MSIESDGRPVWLPIRVIRKPPDDGSIVHIRDLGDHVEVEMHPLHITATAATDLTDAMAEILVVGHWGRFPDGPPGDGWILPTIRFVLEPTESERKAFIVDTTHHIRVLLEPGESTEDAVNELTEKVTDDMRAVGWRRRRDG